LGAGAMRQLYDRGAEQVRFQAHRTSLTETRL
jgi:hypothetical protein